MKRYIKSAKTLEDYEASGKFDEDQLKAIDYLLYMRPSKDIEPYVDPKYNGPQLLTVVQSELWGIDLGQYADPKYSAVQMRCAQNAIRYKDKDVLHLIDLGYDTNYDDLRELLDWAKTDKKLRNLIENNVFESTQIRMILNGLEDGIDIYQYAYPDWSFNEMFSKRRQLEKEAGIYRTISSDF